MHVLLAPDKFKGSLTAAEVADALAEGLAAGNPSWSITCAPVADGGDGTVAAAVAAGWLPVAVKTTGPTGRPIATSYAVRGSTAVVELASAVGLVTLPGGELDPLGASTFGLGTVVRHALDEGAREIIVGVGGSASTDGGAGMLQALGVRILDAQGNDVAPGGAALRQAARVDLSGLHPAARGAHFQLACDVDNPLLGPNGATAVYAPQKGADAEELVVLEDAMTQWARVVRTATGRDDSHTAGAGAAGGTAFGAMSVLGATTRPGIDTVLDLIDFRRKLAGTDFVITGEGSLDVQSLYGKAPIGVAAAAGEAGVPVIAVAGRSVLSDSQLRNAGIRMAYTLADLEPDIHKSIANAAELLRRIGRTIAAASTDFVTTRHEGESDQARLHRATGPRLAHPRRQCVRGERRTVRATGKSHPARSSVLRPERVRSQGKGLRRVGTRRRRDNGHDYAIVRLGTPRIIHGIIVDTAYFKGNYPPFVSIEARISLRRGEHERGLADHRREVPGRRSHRQRLRGGRPAPVDSCATLDLSRRWGREAARTRRGSTGSRSSPVLA